MAQLVIAAAGAAIGGATLGTGIVAFGLTGTAIGWAAGSMLGGLLQKGPNAQGPRLGDLRVSGTEYGQPIPWVAGSPRIAGQIVWASNKREIRNTQKVGKGGGGQRVTTFTYEVDLLYRLTENEIAGVSRIWSNGELVWGNGQTKAGVWNELRIYTGAPDQMPDPTYEAAVGPGNAPAYRGGGTVLIRGLQLGQSGQIPNLTFEVGFADLRETRTSFWLSKPRGFLDQIAPPAVFRDDLPTLPTPSFILEGGQSAVFTSAAKALYGGQQNPSSGLGLIGTFELYVDSIEWNFVSGTQDFRPSFLYFAQLDTPQAIIIDVQHDIPTQRARVLFSTPSGTATGAFFDLPSTRFHFCFQLTFNELIIYINGNVVNKLSYNTLPIFQNTSFFVELHRSYLGNASYFTRIYYGSVRAVPGVNLYPVEGFTPPEIVLIDENLAFGAQVAGAVAAAVNDLMIRAGYDSDEYDVSGLAFETKPLRAFAIGQIGNTRSSLEVLQKACYFEASKSDKIYIRPRAVTPVATIPWADLGTSEDIETDQEPLALQIGSDLELPAQIALSYNNMAADYNVATENSDRLISNQLSTATVQMPLGMLPDEAKGVANALLFDQLASLTRTTIRVPLKYAYIEPGDVVNAVNFDGRTYRIRVIAKRDTLSILEFECVLDDVGALDSAAITDNSYISITDPARVAPTLFEPLDMPILRDADDDAGYYAAVAADRLSASDEWPGAVYVQAFSPGAFEQEFTTGDPCVMGEALTILPNWTGGNEFDESSTVEVEVVGELESSTRDLMLADLAVNAMLIGSEVIRFRLATLLSADGERRTYRLSGLLRGQRGTEWAIGGHMADERVILLNNALRRVPGLLTQIGLERDVKAVTLNLLLSDVPDVAFTNDAVGLKPFAPANVVALADGADLRITWQRRTRLSVRYGGPVDQVVPLGEVSEQYRVRIFDGPTLVHMATVTTPEYLYTDLTAGGFASGDPVTVEVAQLSAIVGAGYPTTTTGTAP